GFMRMNGWTSTCFNPDTEKRTTQIIWRLPNYINLAPPSLYWMPSPIMRTTRSTGRRIKAGLMNLTAGGRVIGQYWQAHVATPMETIIFGRCGYRAERTFPRRERPRPRLCIIRGDFKTDI